MSDFPDWFGQPQFPRYGAVRRSWNSLLATADDRTEVEKIEGKGILYTAYLGVNGERSAVDDTFIFYVDNVVISSGSIHSIRNHGMFFPLKEWFYLTDYRYLERTFAIIFTGRIPFEESVEINYEELSGNTPTLLGELHYSLIT